MYFNKVSIATNQMCLDIEIYQSTTNNALRDKCITHSVYLCPILFLRISIGEYFSGETIIVLEELSKPGQSFDPFNFLMLPANAIPLSTRRWQSYHLLLLTTQR